MTIMTNANELNLQDLDQVSGGNVAPPFTLSGREILLAYERQMASLWTRLMPPNWRDPLHF
jgi:hypothetical protein